MAVSWLTQVEIFQLLLEVFEPIKNKKNVMWLITQITNHSKSLFFSDDVNKY